ncbi:glycosyltransferase family 2 protein [Terrarubrum flagellatum]|uniref:glycosyltransferase family 2 protein n=1 Tax=Terrirubrum flagellatum TaxID=2895980 RepID=UPI0031454E6A
MGLEPPVLSIVIPVYNEAGGLDELVAKLAETMARIEPSFEVVFVNDGSRDATADELRLLCAADSRLSAVSFSRNFGKEIAIAAGLDHARGQAVVIMDADLQHPPEVIAEFLAKWREGYANVYGVRRDRAIESPLKRAFARGFYKLFANFGETELPTGAGDFRLLDRKAVDALKALGERARFSKGLYSWIGFKSIGVPFDVHERAHGSTKWSFRKLLRFALDGITSFSTVPLRVWTYVGLFVSFCAFLAAIRFTIEALFYGITTPGFPTLIVSVMFFAGIQLMSLGILGEYIGRIFAEVKRRPLYIVEERMGFDDAPRPMTRDERRTTDSAAR